MTTAQTLTLIFSSITIVVSLISIFQSWKIHRNLKKIEQVQKQEIADKLKKLKTFNTEDQNDKEII